MSFGRVIVPKKLRGQSMGADLIKEVLKQINHIYGHHKIVIEAQYYAFGFYKKFGFKTVGHPFLDAGRKHIQMIKN